MDVEQLRLFIAVARSGSMSRAAIDMNITQSAVSQSIARLEREIGAKLFIREKRGLVLSESAKVFYQHINKILHQLDEACLEMRESENAVSGILRLQVFAASALMPGLLSEFSHLYPDVRYQMIQQNLRTDFDLCINYVSGEALPTGADLLLDEDVMMAVPRTHPLAMRKNVRLSEMQGDNFILMRQGTALRTLSNSVCNKAGFEPRVVFESDNPSVVREMISMGLGVAFLPQVSWHAAMDDNISLLHIKSPQCRRQLCIYPGQGQTKSIVVKAFRKYAISYFERTRREVMGRDL